MSKLERLNARVTKLLTEAVHEVLEMVKETVSEYQEKTARTMRENESLKRRLQELQDKMSTECTHGSMPEEKEAIESPAQRLSLDVILTEQIPVSLHKLDYEMKLESKEQERNNDSESQAECDLAQASREHCKAQPEERKHIIEEEMTNPTSHNSKTNISALSSDNSCPSDSSSSIGVQLPVIKRESEPTDCTQSASSSLQEHCSGRVDLSLNSSCQNAAESFRHQVAPEPYGGVRPACWLTAGDVEPPSPSSYQEVTESRPSSELEAVDTLREAWHVAMKIHEKIVITYFESGNSRVDKEGYLYKKGEIKTSYQKRWCVLKGNLLFYKERPVDRDVIGVIVLEGCTVQLCESEEQFAFSLVWGEPGLRTYKFAAENQTSQESWIKALLSANHNYLALLVMDMEKKYRDTLSALYGEKANTFTVPHFSTAEAGYSASYQSSHMPTLHSYPGVTVGTGSGLSSTSALQTLSASPKTASKRSPKLWSKRNANAAPSNPAPPMREWVGICEGTKEEFTKLHEDFGKEVKELIADWSRRGRGDAAVQEENLIYFG